MNRGTGGPGAPYNAYQQHPGQPQVHQQHGQPPYQPQQPLMGQHAPVPQQHGQFHMPPMPPVPPPGANWHAPSQPQGGTAALSGAPSAMNYYPPSHQQQAHQHQPQQQHQQPQHPPSYRAPPSSSSAGMYQQQPAAPPQSEAYDPDEPGLSLSSYTPAVEVDEDDEPRGWFTDPVAPSGGPSSGHPSSGHPPGGQPPHDPRRRDWRSPQKDQSTATGPGARPYGSDQRGPPGGRGPHANGGRGGAMDAGRGNKRGRSPPSSGNPGGRGEETRGGRDRSRSRPSPAAPGPTPPQHADPRYPGPRGDRYSPEAPPQRQSPSKTAGRRQDPLPTRPQEWSGHPPPQAPPHATPPMPPSASYYPPPPQQLIQQQQQQQQQQQGRGRSPSELSRSGSRARTGPEPRGHMPPALTPQQPAPQPNFLPSLSPDRPSPASSAPAPATPPGAFSPFVYGPPQLSLCDLELRHPNLYLPSDFTLLVNHWVHSRTPHPLDDAFLATCLLPRVPPLRLDNSTTSPQPPPPSSSAETSSLARRYNVRVLLTQGPSPQAAQGPDSYRDLWQHLHVLVGRRRKGNHLMLPGGAWVPSLDGPNPEVDEGVLIRAAQRTLRHFCNLDVSNCRHWHRLASLHYHRPEEIVGGKQYPEQEEVTVLFLADLSGVTQATMGRAPAAPVPVDPRAGAPSGGGGMRDVEAAVDMFLGSMEEGVLRVMLETKIRASAHGLSGGELRRRLKDVLLREGGLQGQGGLKGVEMGGGPGEIVACPPALGKDEPRDKAVSLEWQPLATLLAYSAAERNERHFEVSLGAETLQGLLNWHHASLLLQSIRHEAIYELGAPPVPIPPIPGQLSPDDAHLLMGNATPRLLDMYMHMVRSRQRQPPPRATDGEEALALFLAFRAFDRQGNGCLSKSQLERILLNLGSPSLSRKDMGRLVEHVLVDPASPAALSTSATASAASTPLFHYLPVLRHRLQRLLAAPQH